MATIHPADNDWQTGKSSTECNTYMLEHEIACDITFLVGKNKQEVRAHKYILISRSPVFQAMFCGPLAETQTAIAMPDIELESFKMLLRYMYCDENVLEGKHDVIEILYAAKKYCVSGLIKECKTAIEQIIDVNNACALLQSADNFDEQGLYRICYTFLLKNGEACLQSDLFCNLSRDCVQKIISADELMSTELTVWKCIVKWAEAECSRQKHVVSSTAMRYILGDLLYCVRFRGITAEEFAKIVSVTDILSEKEKNSIFQFYHSAKETIDRFSMKNKRNCCYRCLCFHSCSKVDITREEKSQAIHRRSANRRYFDQRQRGILVHKIPIGVIKFIVSVPIKIAGMILYGSITAPCTHTIGLSGVKGFSLLRFNVTTNEEEENATLDVMFPDEIQLEQNTQYCLSVQSSSPRNYRGCGVLNSVAAGKTTITFLPCRKYGNNSDIPGLILR